MIKIKTGWEDKKFWGLAGAETILGKPLKDLSQKHLQAIIDGDPTNARNMMEGEASANAPVTDNAPGKPLPTKPPAEPPVNTPTAKAKE